MSHVKSQGAKENGRYRENDIPLTQSGHHSADIQYRDQT